MKLLCVGDIHIKLNKFDSLLILKENIIKTSRETRPDYIVLLGDILHYHEKIHTVELNFACEFIRQLSTECKVIILVGNHDYIQNAQFLTTNHWMNFLKEWKNIEIVDTVFEKEDCIFTPYVPVGRFVEALNLSKKNWKDAKCIFAHQEFRKAKMGAIESIIGDEWEKTFPFVVSGHIHNRQKISNNIYYIGASAPTTFSDQSQPILLFIDTTTLTMSEHVVPIQPKKIIVKYLNTDFQIDEKLENSNTKIIMKGNWEDCKLFQKTNQYKTLVENGVKIAFKIQEKEEIKTCSDEYGSTFTDILYKNMLKERDEGLYCLYQNIVFDKTVVKEDILII